jgi:hemoglobin
MRLIPRPNLRRFIAIPRPAAVGLALGLVSCLLSSPLAGRLHAADAGGAPVKAPASGSVVNTVCPVTGKAADPKVTMAYEGRTYAFADGAARAKWREARENSLYHKLGGAKAIDAAVEAFYVKVLADQRIKHYFEDINMNKQRRKQKEFLAAAFGGPVPWTGKDLRTAHARLPGLSETHFNAVAENLQKTLEELKIKKELIDQVMAIAASTRDEVLNRPKPAK